MKIRYLVLAVTMIAIDVSADNSTLDAAIGGAIGGGAGAAIGNEIGGRDGAIIGGGLGGAVGAAINTDDDSRHETKRKVPSYRYEEPRYDYRRRTSGSRFCPPGQAKKGRC